MAGLLFVIWLAGSNWTDASLQLIRTGARLPEGVVVCTEGVLVADPGGASIRIVSRDGRVRTRTVTPDAESFDFPFDVACTRDKTLVLDRYGRRVIVFDEHGDRATSFPRSDFEPALVDPVAIEIGPDGSVFLLDASEDAVLVFDLEGQFLRRFGQHGSGRSGLNCPHDLALGGDVLFVADSGNRRVQRFRLDGEPLGPIGSYGNGPDQFEDPTGVAVGSQGELYVADHYGHRIQVFGVDGKEIVSRRFESPDRLRYPTRIAADGDGTCYVTCSQLSKVWKLACP